MELDAGGAGLHREAMEATPQRARIDAGGAGSVARSAIDATPQRSRIPNTQKGTGKITEKCVQAFSGRTAMAFHTFVWLDGPVLNVPINARIFLSFCSRP